MFKQLQYSRQSISSILLASLFSEKSLTPCRRGYTTHLVQYSMSKQEKACQSAFDFQAKEIIKVVYFGLIKHDTESTETKLVPNHKQVGLG